MPRPGPRPYECTRKAWHSDRHQPMRGSLIQEIFRVVSEIHSSQTKKNKEWQEKLPVVVLKAEEILYSKANSETEYMDLQTLWDRMNDAINTIIRREESSETGDLLQPCIEAALILGCTARRASRSQRNNNPRSYLNTSTREHNPVLTGVLDNVSHAGSYCLMPPHSSKPSSTSHILPYYSTPARPVTANATQLHMESGSSHTRDINPSMSCPFPFSSENMPPSSRNQAFSTETDPSLGCAYPLYYGAHHQATDSQVVLQSFHGTNFNPVQLGTFQVQSIMKPNEKGFLQDFFTCDGGANVSNRSAEAEISNADEIPSEIECDLSLHLGPLSVSCPRRETRCRHEVENVRPSSSQGGSKSCDHSSKTNMKRNAPFSNFVEAGHSSHHSQFSPDLFFGKMKKPDE
ncbi:Histone acetyltransferase [Thalictrum thalictroides]|uniref:Histone acetyltransferase n=1 Tax=Thalictrum thalictroides TaxID=46969 RepID=A0A7J6VGX6_THATH|nr:Histone acetyltransferase [Thalictrum thalictroides]